MGYRFDFSDVLKRYFVKQHGHIAEYYAIDKPHYVLSYMVELKI